MKHSSRPSSLISVQRTYYNMYMRAGIWLLRTRTYYYKIIIFIYYQDRAIRIYNIHTLFAATVLINKMYYNITSSERSLARYYTQVVRGARKRTIARVLMWSIHVIHHDVKSAVYIFIYVYYYYYYRCEIS